MAYIGLTIRNSEAIQAAISLMVFPMTLTSSVFLPAHSDHARLAANLRRSPTHHHHRQRAARTHPRPRRLPAGYTVIGETMLALTWTAGILAVSAPLAVRAYRRNNN